MNKEYNVFDEWGNFLGKFRPSGASEAGCAFIVTAIIVSIFGFLIFALVKMTIRGVKAAMHGETGVAIANLAIPGILVIAVSYGAITTSIQATAYANADKAQKNAAASKAAEVWKYIEVHASNPHLVLHLGDVEEICTVSLLNKDAQPHEIFGKISAQATYQGQSGLITENTQETSGNYTPVTLAPGAENGMGMPGSIGQNHFDWIVSRSDLKDPNQIKSILISNLHLMLDDSEFTILPEDQRSITIQLPQCSIPQNQPAHYENTY